MVLLLLQIAYTYANVIHQKVLDHGWRLQEFKSGKYILFLVLISQKKKDIIK